jgi:hypothetical protein
MYRCGYLGKFPEAKGKRRYVEMVSTSGIFNSDTLELAVVIVHPSSDPSETHQEDQYYQYYIYYFARI